MPPPKLSFHPPLLNSASPWATTASDLRALLLCPSTGAVTIRTSLLSGFDHRAEQHRYLFFDPDTSRPHPGTSSGPPEPPPPLSSPSSSDKTPVASLNTLGYSPIPLSEYLSILTSLPSTTKKPFIISVTGSPQDILQCYNTISSAAPSIPFPLAMEINLSCPNITSSPPPAYSASSLAAYLAVLPSQPIFPIGIKTPPFTYSDQFNAVISALRGDTNNDDPPASKLSFVTTTNTLGSCLLHTSAGEDALPGGVGGMAGPPLHPLALGNVATLRRMFDADSRLAHLDIIGVGGVYDGEGYKRMRRVGAAAVAIATALGRQGVGVFEAIEKDIGSSW